MNEKMLSFSPGLSLTEGRTGERRVTPKVPWGDYGIVAWTQERTRKVKIMLLQYNRGSQANGEGETDLTSMP